MNETTVDYSEIIEAGRPFFKHIRQVGDKIKTSRKIKGAHRPGVIKAAIAEKKIELVLEEMIKVGIEGVSKAQLTSSVYFVFKGKNIRLSDHKKAAFEGVDILIKWDTNTDEILNQIINL